MPSDRSTFEVAGSPTTTGFEATHRLVRLRWFEEDVNTDEELSELAFEFRRLRLLEAPPRPPPPPPPRRIPPWTSRNRSSTGSCDEAERSCPEGMMPVGSCRVGLPQSSLQLQASRGGPRGGVRPRPGPCG